MNIASFLAENSAGINAGLADLRLNRTDVVAILPAKFLARRPYGSVITDGYRVFYVNRRLTERRQAACEPIYYERS